MKAFRILVADDHPIFRQGIRGLLEDEADITLVGEAADGQEAIYLGTQHRRLVAELFS